MSKVLIFTGLALIAAGLFWQFAGRFLSLGKLPGDIAIEKENFKFYFPLASSILVSVLLSLVLYVIGRFRN